MPPAFDLRYQSEERANCEPWNWYTLDDYLEGGFFGRPDVAQAWMDADIYPHQARLYEELGLTPQDAWDWVMVPEAVRSFVDGGFTEEEAWDWANFEIFGYETMFWREGGFTPWEAHVLRDLGKPVAQAVLWAVTGLSPADAFDHARDGANPADFLSPPDLEGSWAALPDDWDGRLHQEVLDD